MLFGEEIENGMVHYYTVKMYIFLSFTFGLYFSTLDKTSFQSLFSLFMYSYMVTNYNIFISLQTCFFYKIIIMLSSSIK